MVSGWLSAPRTYVTDRLYVVVSGVWWCNSGSDFDPGKAFPVYPGGFVRRVAGTPHYDGALPPLPPNPRSPLVTGTGPVRQAWVDPAQRWVHVLGNDDRDAAERAAAFLLGNPETVANEVQDD